MLLTEDVKQVLKNNYKIDFYNRGYLGDKIKIYEATVGKNEFSKLLWKINMIRNDLSHTRIDKLFYKKQDLSLRETKEVLLTDLFTQMINHGEPSLKVNSK
ncbi:MAG: hypothetical protein NTZ13_01580 [Candidatus Parcubacteria bacterium]|nr:hypothetical protein [Candidatus Parcubacteria bacterium]